MDRIRFILTAIALAVLMVSCEIVRDEARIIDVEPSELYSFPYQRYVLKNTGEDVSVLMTAVWTETKWYTADNRRQVPVAPVTYALQMDLSGEDFDTPVTVAQTSMLGVDITTREFNLLLLDSLMVKAGEEARVDFRILARYGQSGGQEQVSSNVQTLAVVPYQDRDPLQMLYLAGDVNGWVTDDPSGMLPMFKDNSAITNHTYIFTGYIPDGSEFQLVPQDCVTTGMMYFDGGDGKLVYAMSGDPFTCQNGGYKRITVNLRTMLWTMEDFDASSAGVWGNLGFIGSFCNWENEPLMSRIASSNPHLWYLEYELPPLISGEVHSVKFRAERSWGSRWAAVSPEETPYGQMIFLTMDEADPNIVLREGGLYGIYFNDLTGHYAIIKR